jgi:light-regulated signal transduction histidine kinase (bacteriophytochrome)
MTAVPTDLQAVQLELEATKKQLEQMRFKLSHDLRAPLRHIRAFTQVIEEDHGASLPAEVNVHLKTIADSAQKLSGMIDALLQDTLQDTASKMLQK